MGKRTGPIGFRARYSEKWVEQSIGPSYKIRFKCLTVAENALLILLEKKGFFVFWQKLYNRSFFYEIHIFISEIPSIQETLEVRTTLYNLFGAIFRINYHKLSFWIKNNALAKKKIKSSLGGHWRVKNNRFFFRIASLLQTGFFCLDANLFSKVVKDLLIKHKRHWLVFKFVNFVLQRVAVEDPFIFGVKIQISGKINGRSRKRKKILAVGPMSLQTISNDIDYSYKVVVTKFGVFGVKVWLFRGQKYLKI